MTEDDGDDDSEEGDDDEIIYIQSDPSDEEKDTIIKCVDDSIPSKKVRTRKILDVIGIAGRYKGEIGIRKLKDCNLRGIE